VIKKLSLGRDGGGEVDGGKIKIMTTQIGEEEEEEERATKLHNGDTDSMLKFNGRLMRQRKESPGDLTREGLINPEIWGVHEEGRRMARDRS
jgi:hypothetical protein